MLLTINPIYSSGAATVTKRWHAVNFFNRIIFINPNNDIVYYSGATPMNILAGLPLDELRWDGGVSFYNHVVLWRGNTLRWSDLNDPQNWIPVGATSGTGVANTTTGFTQPTTGSLVTTSLDADPTGWVEGTFVRASYTLSGVPYVNYYTVSGVNEPTGKQAVTISSSQTTSLTRPLLFTEESTNFGAGALIKVQGQTNTLEVVSEFKKSGFAGVLSAPFTRPTGSNTTTITFSAKPVGMFSGDFISIAPNSTTPSRPGQDIYQIAGVSADGVTFTVFAMDTGTNQQNHIAGDNVIYQPAVELSLSSPFITALGFSLLIDSSQVTLRNEGLSGVAPQGATIPPGTQLIPLTANEAGQYRGAGGEDRGSIQACLQLGDLLYVFRKRGIQTVQYTGRPEVFIIRDEISDEGLLGKYLWVKVGSDEAYFWGHREMYKMTGSQIEPVAQQVSKQMLRDEFDFSRVDEYLMYHNENDKEIWTIYRPKTVTNPNKGNLKIMIYNYVEDSCVFDEWDEDINGVTAIGGLNLSDGTRSTMFGALNNQITTAADKFLVYGEIDGAPIYSFLGRNMLSEAVTADMDFGDATAWKYIDTIRLDMYIKNPLVGRPFRLWVQFGGRDNLDSDTKWTAGQWIDVSGSGNIVTKVNQRVSGRFIAVKFLSEQAGIQWRIASYTLSGRLGGTF